MAVREDILMWQPHDPTEMWTRRTRLTYTEPQVSDLPLPRSPVPVPNLPSDPAEPGRPRRAYTEGERT